VKKTQLTPHKTRHLKARYRVLASRIAGFEALSQGSVTPQPARAGRSRKVGGKTFSLGLAPDIAEKMKQAIANLRALDKKIIDEIREITQKPPRFRRQGTIRKTP